MQQGTGSSRLALVCRKKGAAEQTENGTDNGACIERNDVRGSGECRGRRADTNPTSYVQPPTLRSKCVFVSCVLLHDARTIAKLTRGHAGLNRWQPEKMYQLLALAVRGWLREVQADGGSGGANLECGGLDSDGDLRELNSGIFFVRDSL